MLTVLFYQYLETSVIPTNLSRPAVKEEIRFSIAYTTPERPRRQTELQPSTPKGRPGQCREVEREAKFLIISMVFGGKAKMNQLIYSENPNAVFGQSIGVSLLSMSKGHLSVHAVLLEHPRIYLAIGNQQY